MPFSDFGYNFRKKEMFGSSLPAVVCRKANALFTLFVFVLHIVVSNTYCVVFLLCLSTSCIRCVASFSGLSIVDCPFGVL